MGGSEVHHIVAGAGAHVVDCAKGIDLKAGDETLACLTDQQLDEVNDGAKIRVASCAMCRKPSNMSASQGAALVTQFLAAAALLERADALAFQHLAERWSLNSQPKNIALMVNESKSNTALVRLLCHLFPGVDILFCYNAADTALPKDYPQGLHFMLALESSARASARYSPNSKHDLAGYFRANAEAYTNSSSVGLAIDTAGMLKIKPEVRDILKDQSRCFQGSEGSMDVSKVLVREGALKVYLKLVESQVIRPVMLNFSHESY